jgi:ubiquinone/menaquinone biosynthesis C-methylase UbiE
MEAQLEQIRNQQRETWNKFSPGWRKWDDFTMNFLKPMGEAIIQFIQPKNDDTILDIAAGTGEPGLTIAGMVGKGKVIITDLAERMLEVARENAASRNITNIETVACDVSQLLFDDNTFDAISCRKGFMFFPDVEMAAKEMVRVLKPGGRIAASVWNGPEKNVWITSMTSVINSNIQLQQPPPGAPGMFRCAKPAMMTDLFKQVGLNNITEIEINGELKSNAPDKIWSFHTEVAAPVVAALARADEATKNKIKKDFF